MGKWKQVCVQNHGQHIDRNRQQSRQTGFGSLDYKTIQFIIKWLASLSMAESSSGDRTVIDVTVTNISKSGPEEESDKHTWYTYLPYHFPHDMVGKE